MSEGTQTEVHVEFIARMCHEVNKAYCLAIGDSSQDSWEDAPQWQRDSVIKGVQFVLTHPNAVPSDNHKAWLEAKEADGWKYGPMKNVTKKEHPCYVPYEKLPVEQRVKDYLFQAVVRSFVNA